MNAWSDRLMHGSMMHDKQAKTSSNLLISTPASFHTGVKASIQLWESTLLVPVKTSSMYRWMSIVNIECE